MSLLPLDFPELDRDQLKSCATRKEALEAWLQELPLAHPMASQEQLSQLMDEFNRLRLPPPRRLEWLKLIAATANPICQELEFQAHQGIEAEATQRLQRQLSQGYKRSLHDLLKLRSQLPPSILGPALLEALFYAIVHTSSLIRRACQFSIEAPAGTWRELYLLYRLACQSKLQNRPVPGQKAPHTCETAYCQALLLGIIQAENLGRFELARLYPYLADWANQLQLTSAQSPDASFLVLASRQFFPERNQAAYPINNEQDFGLNTRPLSELLQRQLEAADNPLNNRLLQHLIALTSEPSERAAPRVAASGPIDLVLGWRSVHFHLNGKQPFEQLATGGNLTSDLSRNPFLTTPDSQDPWSAAPDATENQSKGSIQWVEMEKGGLSRSAAEERDKRYPVHSLQQVNTSATGYCLAWVGQAPANLITGELIALREKRQDPWQAGVIRWVRPDAKGQQLGVELLASRLQACAVQPIIKIGDPIEQMPGFYLPALPVLGTPASLLTPLLPFREGQKVAINRREGKERARLVKLLSSPGEFNQFQLEPLGASSFNS